MSVILTERAADEVRRAMNDGNIPETYVLRVGIRGGGCSGFNYALGFDPATDSAKDEVTEQFGVKLAVDKKSSLYLDGTKIDFVEELTGRGFKFENPNAKNSCGCGNSFSS